MSYEQGLREFEKWGVWDSKHYGTYNVGSNRKKRYVRELRAELKQMVRKEKKRLGVTKLPSRTYKRLRNFTGVNSYE